MKVVLTGPTGFIGREVLDQCYQHPSVTSIVALTRRQLPPHVSENAKVETVLVDNFLFYSPAVMHAIGGADACIWCLGKAWMNDSDTAKTVHVDFTMMAAKALTNQTIDDSGNTRRLRFVYLSGGLAERDQEKPLWFQQDYRRIRGQVENVLHDHFQNNPNTFEPYIIRPGFVVAKERSVRNTIRSWGPSVRVDNLAKAMLMIALDGCEENTLGNRAILAQATRADSSS
ncbi:hypothetical protein GGR53DRAFT_415726 [Hypoxylon sp. FL1150]|nr:hypothetical protein GGR53DRAFT_415726 [Hypoxylon sp. FL1150]